MSLPALIAREGREVKLRQYAPGSTDPDTGDRAETSTLARVTGYLRVGAPNPAADGVTGADAPMRATLALRAGDAAAIRWPVPEGARRPTVTLGGRSWTMEGLGIERRGVTTVHLREDAT